MADDRKPRAVKAELKISELDQVQGGASATEPPRKPALGNQPFTPHFLILPYIEQEN